MNCILLLRARYPFGRAFKSSSQFHGVKPNRRRIQRLGDCAFGIRTFFKPTVSHSRLPLLASPPHLATNASLQLFETFPKDALALSAWTYTLFYFLSRLLNILKKEPLGAVATLGVVSPCPNSSVSFDDGRFEEVNRGGT